jgi:hypothetical protein
VGLGASATKKTTTELNTPNSVQTSKLRYPHSGRYVPHEDVPRYLEIGWEWTSALVDTHHGEHATFMVWPHETDPPNV